MSEMTKEQSPATRWEIRIGSPVECVDGWVGTVERLVVSPRTREVTHLIIHRGLLLHRDAAIPIEAVESADEELVRLNLSSAELTSYPPYNPVDYVSASADWQPPTGYAREHILFALPRPLARMRRLVAATSGPVAHADIGSSAEAPTISTGTRVEARDGPIGNVDRVLLDPTTHQATHFVVRKGTLFGHDLIVPVDWAIKVRPEGIVLDVGREQLSQLPEYRPDDELATDVEQALWNDEILRRVDLPFLHTKVQDGIVILEGYVATSVHRQRAEEIVHNVRGVLGVDNRLIGDDELEIAVAQALGRDERTRRHRIRVRARHGIVYLSGDIVQAALDIAAAVPHVRKAEIESVTDLRPW